jgi:hypothetical protein
VYVEWRDWWIGVFLDDDATYVCPLPCLVVKIDRSDA